MSPVVWMSPATTGARPAALEHEALDAIALHLDRDVLDVEHDVDDVLADAGNRRELVQHAVDVDRGDRGALQRGKQHPAQRVAERLAEAALERLGDDGRVRRWSSLGMTSSFFGLMSSCQFFWITGWPSM